MSYSTSSPRPAPADFHTLAAFPLPALVVCELLGVPTRDRADFCRWQIEGEASQQPAVARGGLQSLWRYLGTLIERKCWTPSSNLITDLLAAAELDPALTDEGIAHLAAGLLARMKLQYLFIRTFERFPALHLAAPLGEITPVREAVAGGVNHLPVTW